MKIVYLLLPIALCKIVYLDSTESVEILPNEHLDLIATENPTTEYLWKVDPESSPKLCVINGSEGNYLHAKMEPIGVFGKQTFHVDCNQCYDGEENVLILKYIRPWDETPVSVKQIRIITKA